MYLDPLRTVGFGLLRNADVYPHFFARHAERICCELVARYPELLGIGIDETPRLSCMRISLRSSARGKSASSTVTGWPKEISDVIERPKIRP